MARLAALALLAGMLTACSGPSGSEPEATGRPEILPGDFVLLPCHEEGPQPCAIVLAGGKSLMFGAPAGAGANADPGDLANLQALFLFSMHPEDVEGVDEIRNRGWRAGRGGALPLAGPAGTESLVRGLNLAFEQPDAISFVEDGAPPGGFDAALLSLAGAVDEVSLVYDSGDLKVSAFPGKGSTLRYRIEYRDLAETRHTVLLAPCDAGDAPEAKAEAGLVIGCAGDGAGPDRSWPLLQPVFAVKAER